MVTHGDKTTRILQIDFNASGMSHVYILGMYVYISRCRWVNTIYIDIMSPGIIRQL